MKSCKQTALKIINDLQNQRVLVYALTDAFECLSLENENLIASCIVFGKTEETIIQLTELAGMMVEAMVIAEFPCGEQHKSVYPDNVCIDVLRTYHKKGIKAWIELV